MSNPVVMVDDERTVLVSFWEDGSITVATRPEPGAVWGPPIRVHPEHHLAA